MARRRSPANGSSRPAGYRAVEKFVGVTSSRDAVSRTSNVTGKLTLVESAGGFEANGITVAGQLTGLHSNDSVAGFNVADRDRMVSQDPDVSQYPTATFASSGAIALPAAVHDGQVANLTMPGTLTVRGRSRQVGASIHAENLNGQLRVAGRSTPR